MHHKRRHPRHHSSCGLCKPHKNGWQDPRTFQEKRADAAARERGGKAVHDQGDNSSLDGENG